MPLRLNIPLYQIIQRRYSLSVANVAILQGELDKHSPFVVYGTVPHQWLP